MTWAQFLIKKIDAIAANKIRRQEKVHAFFWVSQRGVEVDDKFDRGIFNSMTNSIAEFFYDDEFKFTACWETRRRRFVEKNANIGIEFFMRTWAQSSIFASVFPSASCSC